MHTFARLFPALTEKNFAAALFCFATVSSSLSETRKSSSETRKSSLSQALTARPICENGWKINKFMKRGAFFGNAIPVERKSNK